MSKVIFFILFSTLTLFAKSSDFSIIVHKPFDAALLDVTQDYDRGISAVGFSKDYKTDINPSKSYDNAFDYLADTSDKLGTQMHLLKVNKNGKIILSKTSKLSKFSEAIAITKTPNNGYFIGGYTMDGSLLVIKTNAQGKTLFYKKFGTKNYDRMNNLIMLSDGGVLAVGSSVTSRAITDNIFKTGLGKNDIFLTRFSKNGQELWSKKYGTEYDDRGIDAVEAHDGSIVVVSTTSYDKHKNATLMRLTENGNMMWLKHYKRDKLITPHKIIRLKDNNFLIALSQYNDAQKEQVRLIKFDLYKNILEDKTIFTTYPSIINDIKEFSDGTLMGVGLIKDTFNTDGLVMVFDSHLALLTQNHYGKENFDTFNALHILNNSQIAVAGIHTDENSQETNMWLLKLNKDTTLAQKPTQTKTIHSILHEIFSQEITQKKLTISDDLHIEFTASSLYFEKGKYKLTKEQTKFLKIFAYKISYFVKNNAEFLQSIEINGHTSSEWNKVDFTQRYLKNEKLSLERSFSVLSYIFSSQDITMQKVFIKLFKGSGLSFSKKVLFNANEDKKRSRRVSFSIILK